MCRFGSWTYDGSKLDIVARRHSGFLYLGSYLESCPSVIQRHEARRNAHYYECCPEPYIDIVYKLQLAWR